MVWFWIVVIGVVLYLMSKGGGGGSQSASTRSASRGTGSARATRVSSAPVSERVQPEKGFRPQHGESSRSSGIRFESGDRGAGLASFGEQVTDFVTGAALRTSASTYQCTHCLAYYSPESFSLLQAENGSRCASCRSVNLRVLGRQASQRTQRTAPPVSRATGPGTASLFNFRSFEGQVVTFTGRVIKVLESRRGGDFAVMFEDKSWKQGFKLVFFKGALSALGGPAYARSLHGATITVRGLIVNHSQFGYEIIANDRRMVRRVDR